MKKQRAIRVTGRKYKAVRLTGPMLPRIEGEEVAAALGAEIVDERAKKQQRGIKRGGA